VKALLFARCLNRQSIIIEGGLRSRLSCVCSDMQTRRPAHSLTHFTACLLFFFTRWLSPPRPRPEMKTAAAGDAAAASAVTGSGKPAVRRLKAKRPARAFVAITYNDRTAHFMLPAASATAAAPVSGPAPPPMLSSALGLGPAMADGVGDGAGAGVSALSSYTRVLRALVCAEFGLPDHCLLSLTVPFAQSSTAGSSRSHSRNASGAISVGIGGIGGAGAAAAAGAGASESDDDGLDDELDSASGSSGAAPDSKSDSKAKAGAQHSLCALRTVLSCCR
jgi:hypothetical protein